MSGQKKWKFFFAILFFSFTGRTTAMEYMVIDHEELKQLVDRALRIFMLIDVRNPIEFRKHITLSVTQTHW